MRGWLALLKRDLVLSWRMGGGSLSGALFLLTLTVLLPLGLGPNLVQLGALAAPMIFIGALLASLLTLDRVFQADAEDGTLDLLLLSPLPAEAIALAKIAAHWLVCGLPLALIAPLYAVMLGLPETAIPALMLSLLLGTPAFSALGAFGAALTLNLKRGGLLLPLLVLPLAIPVLLFGTLVAAPAALSLRADTPWIILAGLSLFALALSPLGTALALKAGRV